MLLILVRGFFVQWVMDHNCSKLMRISDHECSTQNETLSLCVNTISHIQFKEHLRGRGRKNGRTAGWKGALWHGVFQTWHRCCTQEFTAGVITSISSILHAPPLAKEKESQFSLGVWPLEDYPCFSGYFPPMGNINWIQWVIFLRDWERLNNMLILYSWVLYLGYFVVSFFNAAL